MMSKKLGFLVLDVTLDCWVQQLMLFAKFLILTLIGKKKFSRIGIIYKMVFCNMPLCLLE